MTSLGPSVETTRLDDIDLYHHALSPPRPLYPGTTYKSTLKALLDSNYGQINYYGLCASNFTTLLDYLRWFTVQWSIFWWQFASWLRGDLTARCLYYFIHSLLHGRRHSSTCLGRHCMVGFQKQPLNSRRSTFNHYKQILVTGATYACRSYRWHLISSNVIL